MIPNPDSVPQDASRRSGRMRTPVVVIGGFLGAGKTTLLNHVLTEQHGIRVAVLVNDFGAINIDASLVVGFEGETISLANGCICCTIRDDLAGACLALLNRPEPPNLVLVELSGVSAPGPVLNTLIETELSAAFTLSSMLTVVDAEKFVCMKGATRELVQSQVSCADIVILNKADLVDPRQLTQAQQQLRELSPGVPVLTTTLARVPMELLLWPELGNRKPRTIGSPGALGGHDHSFTACHWMEEQPLSLTALRTVLEDLPDTIIRCKGVICLEELPTIKFALQMVGKRYEFEQCGGWEPERPRSAIVMIAAGDAIDAAAMRRALDSTVGTGDAAGSPVLRLVQKIAPQLLLDPRQKAS